MVCRSIFYREQVFRNLNYSTRYHLEIFLISSFAHKNYFNAPFALKNYFNVLDVAIAVVMPLSEGYLAKTELTFLK